MPSSIAYLQDVCSWNISYDPLNSGSLKVPYLHCWKLKGAFGIRTVEVQRHLPTFLVHIRPFFFLKECILKYLSSCVLSTHFLDKIFNLNIFIPSTSTGRWSTHSGVMLINKWVGITCHCYMENKHVAALGWCQNQWSSQLPHSPTDAL